MRQNHYSLINCFRVLPYPREILVRVVSAEFTCTIELYRKRMWWIGCVESGCIEAIVHNRFVSKKKSVARRMWMTECAETKYGQSGCIVTRRIIIEMCSKRRDRNGDGVETDVVYTKCAQSSCVGKRGCQRVAFVNGKGWGLNFRGKHIYPNHESHQIAVAG